MDIPLLIIVLKRLKKRKINLSFLKKIISDSNYAPIKLEDILTKFSENPKNVSNLLYLLQNQDDIIALGDSLFLDKQRFRDILKIIKDFFLRKTEMGVSDFKQLLGLSRKNAIPLLEYLDKQRYTERDKNFRRKGDQLNEC